MPKKKTATLAKKPRAKSSAAKSGGKIPTVTEMREAAARARGWLAEREDYHGYLVKKDQGRGAPELATHLRGDIQAQQRRDGYWLDPDEDAPSLVLTSEYLFQLLNLGLAGTSRAVERGIEWMYSMRGADGAFGEGTALDHTLTPIPGIGNGFFSPCKSDEAMEITLPNGQHIASDAGARLLASERAMRTILRANMDDAQAVPSVAALRGAPLYLEYGGTFTPAVLVGAIQALAWTHTPYIGEVVAGLEALRDNGEADGSWPNVEFFFVLEMLLEVRHPMALRMMEGAMPRLYEGQHKNGSWGRGYMAPQTWIGLNVLERLVKAAMVM